MKAVGADFDRFIAKENTAIEKCCADAEEQATLLARDLAKIAAFIQENFTSEELLKESGADVAKPAAQQQPSHHVQPPPLPQ